MLLSYFGLPGVAIPHDDRRASLLLSLPDGEDDRLLAVAAALFPLG